MTASSPATGRTNTKNQVWRLPSMRRMIASATIMSEPEGIEAQDSLSLKASRSWRNLFERAETDSRPFSRVNGTRSCTRYLRTGSDVLRFGLLPLRLGRIVHVRLQTMHWRRLPPYLMTEALQQEDFACFLFIHAKCARKTLFHLVLKSRNGNHTNRINLYICL